MDLEEIKSYLGDETHGLVKELFNAILDYCFYTVIDKAHNNNPNNKLSTNNVMLASFLQRGYAVNQIITIGRLMDDDSKAVSLKGIIDDLISLNCFDKSKLYDLLNIIKKSVSIKRIMVDRHKLIAHLDKERFSTRIDTTLEDIRNTLIVLAYIVKELSYMTSKTIESFNYYTEPSKLFDGLDFPFFFPEEVDDLVKYFYTLQTDFDKEIRAFNS